MACEKCTKIMGAGWLILGILFLLRDLGQWNFWNISWWTAVLLWIGIGKLCATSCGACKAMGKRK